MTIYSSAMADPVLLRDPANGAKARGLASPTNDPQPSNDRLWCRPEATTIAGVVALIVVLYLAFL